MSFGGFVRASYVFAALSLIGGWLVFHAFVKPTNGRPFELTYGAAISSFVFTGIVGIFLLSYFQEAAKLARLNPTWIAGRGVAALVFGIVKVIGIAYDIAFDQQGNRPWPVRLGAMLLSVGPCEELLKIFPVAVLLRAQKPIQLNLRNTLFVGALSGLGFGVFEGIHFSRTMYLPNNHPLGTYILRFVSLAWGHGLLTMLSAVFLFKARETVRGTIPNFQAAFLGIPAFLVYICSASIFIHAVYNTFCGAFGIPIALLIAGLIWLFGNYEVPIEELQTSASIPKSFR